MENSSTALSSFINLGRLLNGKFSEPNEWCFIGSFALRLRGYHCNVSDLDILTKNEKVNEAFLNFFIQMNFEVTCNDYYSTLKSPDKKISVDIGHKQVCDFKIPEQFWQQLDYIPHHGVILPTLKPIEMIILNLIMANNLTRDPEKRKRDIISASYLKINNNISAQIIHQRIIYYGLSIDNLDFLNSLL